MDRSEWEQKKYQAALMGLSENSYFLDSKRDQSHYLLNQQTGRVWEEDFFALVRIGKKHFYFYIATHIL